MSANISMAANVYNVQSYTDYGVTYDVTENASRGRPWMCSCKAWIFARKDPRTGFKNDCKHIRAVQAAGKTAQRVAAMATTGKLAPIAATEVTIAGEQMKVSRRPEPKLI